MPQELADSRRKRLISFLGTGNYKEADYRIPGGDPSSVRTCYVAVGLTRALGIDEAIIVATEQAEAKHGLKLRAAFAAEGLPSPRFERIAMGASPEDVWTGFALLHGLLAEPNIEVVLDITHGFRSQPFFAAAVVNYAHAVAPKPLPVRILYGAYEATTETHGTPVWDLTPFVELVEWSHALGHFLRTGDARIAAERTERIGIEAARDWARTRQGAPPAIKEFARALLAFSDALVTVRTGELLLDRRKGEKPAQGPARANALREKLAAARKAIQQRVPPVSEILDRLDALLAPLVVPGLEHLSGGEGHGAVTALARLYSDLGRYSESAAVLREAWVNRYATPGAARPGAPSCGKDARKQAERAWFAASPELVRRIGDIRNDIEHAGFRSDPLPPETIRDQLDQRIAELESAEPLVYERRPQPGRTFFVTRHAGAKEWAEREGFEVDEVIDHLDLNTVRAGDRVIGSLPVNLAAEVCARGARYLHLSLDLPRELRGMELSADDLRRLGARLEAFDVERGSVA